MDYLTGRSDWGSRTLRSPSWCLMSRWRRVWDRRSRGTTYNPGRATAPVETARRKPTSNLDYEMDDGVEASLAKK